MSTYTDEEIDEAIERIAADVVRRSSQPEFHGPAMQALVDQLRRMETARRSGDHAAAMEFVVNAQPAFDAYRPTNATSRSKAVLGEVMLELLVPSEPEK
jgi:hypothetical protein